MCHKHRTTKTGPVGSRQQSTMVLPKFNAGNEGKDGTDPDATASAETRRACIVGAQVHLIASGLHNRQ
jgi:hypothetical protein